MITKASEFFPSEIWYFNLKTNIHLTSSSVYKFCKDVSCKNAFHQITGSLRADLSFFHYVIASFKILWHRGVVVTTTAQLYSTKPEVRFCAGSNHACNVSEIGDGEDL